MILLVLPRSIALVDHFHRAFRMHQHFDARIFRPKRIHVLGAKHGMHAAMPLPQEHLGIFNRRPRVSPQRLRMRIPQRHFRQRNPHRLGRVASQMLIGKEQHPLRPLERPLQHRRRIARGAHNPAVPPAKRFQIRRRVDVRHRRDVVRIDHLAQLFPATFHLIDRRHIRHRAPGRHIRQHHRHALPAALRQLIRPIGHNIRRLRHEVHAAKRNVPAIFAIRRHPAELITVPLQIRQRNHLVLLIVMPQNQQPRPHLRAHRIDPPRKLFVRKPAIRLEFPRRGSDSCTAHRALIIESREFPDDLPICHSPAAAARIYGRWHRLSFCLLLSAFSMLYLNHWLTVKDPATVDQVRSLLAEAARLSRQEPGCHAV